MLTARSSLVLRRRKAFAKRRTQRATPPPEEQAGDVHVDVDGDSSTAAATLLPVAVGDVVSVLSDEQLREAISEVIASGLEGLNLKLLRRAVAERLRLPADALDGHKHRVKKLFLGCVAQKQEQEEQNTPTDARQQKRGVREQQRRRQQQPHNADGRGDSLSICAVQATPAGRGSRRQVLHVDLRPVDQSKKI